MDRSKAISVYRSLVRAAKLCFAGDEVALNASRDKIRREYAVPVADKADFLKRIQFGKDVAHILRSNVVQGVKNEKGNFKLAIHQHTELGDNKDNAVFRPHLVPEGKSSGCCGGKTPSN